MEQRYETVIIFDSALQDTEIKSQIDKIEETIKVHSGTLEKQDLWGKRKLAYLINDKEYGFYVILIFNGDNTLASELGRQLKLNETVLRYLTVIKDKHAPDRVPGRSDEVDSSSYFQGDRDGFNEFEFDGDLGRV